MKLEQPYYQAPITNWNNNYILLGNKNKIPLMCEFNNEKKIYFLKPNSKLDEITFDNFKAGLDNLKKVIEEGDSIIKENPPRLSYAFDTWNDLSDWKYVHPSFLVMMLSYQNQFCSLGFKATSPQTYTCKSSINETFLEKNMQNFLGPNLAKKNE